MATPRMKRNAKSAIGPATNSCRIEAITNRIRSATSIFCRPILSVIGPNTMDPTKMPISADAPSRPCQTAPRSISVAICGSARPMVPRMYPSQTNPPTV